MVSTGYGRVNVPFAQKSYSEIICHGRGIASLFPNVRTLLDIGGQDCKVIRINAQGKVENFVMNDKCAAGTGRYLERVSKVIGVSLEELGNVPYNLKGGLHQSAAIVLSLPRGTFIPYTGRENLLIT